MKSIEMIGTIKNGRFISTQAERFRLAMEALPEGTYINKLEKLFGKRTNKMNRLYWGYILPQVLNGLKEIGHEAETVEEVHDILKKLFLKPKGKRKRLVNKRSGEYMYIMPERSTKKLTTVEMSTYFDKIILWSAEFLNIEITMPDDLIGEDL
jgi:hypothetical protein